MRIRGTALVFRNNNILVVRDRGVQKFSLPGGKKNQDEPSLATAIRELYEELGMSAKKAERLFHCDYQGTVNRHTVSFIETEDEPYLRDQELVEFLWWDGSRPIPRYPNVDKILEKYHHFRLSV